MTKAAVWLGPNSKSQVEDIKVSEPAVGEVRVTVVAAGVCHSDLHLALGHLGSHRFPTVLGHEGAGVVDAVGDGVSSVGPGDRVAFCFIASCGNCRQCRRGHPNLCEPGSKAAFSGTMLDGTSRMRRSDDSPLQQFLTIGAFSEVTVVPVESVVKVPDSLPLEQAALVGCAVLTGFGAVRNAAGVQAGDRVAVIGCGGVGLQVIAAARMAGAESIVAIDPVASKRDLAIAQGASEFTSPEDARGPFDFVFEVVGRAETIELGWRLVDNGGSVVVVGIAPAGVEATIRAIDFASEKTLRGSFYGSGNPSAELADLAKLAADGKVDLARVVSHTTDLAGIDEAFGRLQRGEGARTVVLF